jgi:hypothetical protein
MSSNLRSIAYDLHYYPGSKNYNKMTFSPELYIVALKKRMVYVLYIFNLYISNSARKRNKKAENAKLNKNRIYIGDEYDRWMEIKTAVRLETNSEVAKILLDR